MEEAGLCIDVGELKEPAPDTPVLTLDVNAPRVREARVLRVVTGNPITSVAALVALLGDGRLVGMTRAQRQIQIPAPKVVGRPREEARAKRRLERQPSALDLACREVRRRAALLAPAFPKPAVRP